MSFTSDWLGLREPADRIARDQALARRLAGWLSRQDTIEIADLGSGTGANPRWLAPLLPAAQRWRLYERDPALIAQGS